MKKFLEKYSIPIFILASVELIVILALIIINFCGKTSWDWGSFLGGIVGGVSTLIAVMMTIHQTREIQNEGKDSKILESALVIYYDFRFALIEIKNFYEKKQTTLSNIYIDQNWIHTMPQIAGKLKPEELQLAYNLYGALSDLLKAVDGKKILIWDDVKQYVSDIYTESGNSLILKKNIEKLITGMESILKEYGYKIESSFSL